MKKTLEYSHSKTLLLIGAMFCMSLFLVNFTSAFDWNKGLIHYYEFNETSGTNAQDIRGLQIGQQINATLSAGALFRGGKLGNGVFLDGTNDMVNISLYTGEPSGTNDFTISIWQNTSSDQSALYVLINNNVTPYTASGTIAIDSNVATAMTGYTGVSGASGSNFPANDNTWVHIVFSGNSTGTSLYMNGTRVATGTHGSITSGDIFLGAKYLGISFMKGMVDEFGIWNRSLSVYEIGEIYNSGNGLAYSPIIPTMISLEIPANDTQISDIGTNFTVSSSNLSSQNYLWKNITYYLWNSSGIFNKTYVNFVDIDDMNETLYIDEFKLGNYKWNANVCYGNTTFDNCSWAESNYTFFVGLTVNTINYTTPVLGGSLNNFSLNLTYPPELLTSSGISVILNYNNTNYSTTKTGSGSNLVFSRQVIAPSVASATNKSFYFMVSLNNGVTTTVFNSDVNNQTVSPFLIDNCGAYTKVLLNFTMFDEETLLAMNGTILVNVNLYSYGTTTLANSYNTTFDYRNGTESKICLKEINSSYTMGYSIKHYGNDSYFKRYRTIQALTVTNDTALQNIALYNLLSDSGKAFDVIVVGNFLGISGNANLLVDTQRQYLSLNQFKSVESSVTSAGGVALTHLIQSDDVYNFIVSYNGAVVGTFNNYRVKCQNEITSQCSITLNLAQATATLPSFENYGGISQVFLLDIANRTLYQTFISTDGSAHTVRSLVIKDDGYANETICDNTIYGTSGTIQCLIPVSYQNQSFFVQTIVDGTYIGSKYFSQGTETDWYGVDIFMMLLMFSSIVLLLVGHPTTIIIGSIVGFFAPVLLLYISGVSFGGVIMASIYYLVGGGIAIWRISKLQW